MTETTHTPLEDILSPARNPEPPTNQVEAAAPVEQQAAPPAPEPEAQPAAPVPPKPTEPPEGMIPFKAYREEKAKRQEYEAQIAQMHAMLQQAAQPPAAPPDIFADPEGFRQAIYRDMQKQANAMRMQIAQTQAIARHGYEKVSKAQEWADQRMMADPAFDARIKSAPNPWDEAVSAFAQHQLLEAIGSDPEAYRQRVIAEYLAAQGQQPAAPAAPPAAPQLPTNLAQARGAGTRTVPFQPTPLEDILKQRK